MVGLLPAVGLLVAGFLGLFLVAGCQRPVSGGTGTSSESKSGASESNAEVIFYPSNGAAAVRFHVELATTQEAQERGLMYRRSLEADAGMLFIFDHAEIRRFWMRNTYIPLDMIFLDAQRTVVGIEENTVPLDETGRGPDRPAQFVVEVRGGYARSHGIGLGARAEFRNVN